MAQLKFTLYKHVKINGQWRYFRAAVASNNKVQPHVILVGGKEEKHEDGSYCVRHRNQWIDVGNDPAEALRRRTRLSQADSAEAPAAEASATSNIPLAEALEKYLEDKEALGLDSDTISTYRRDITSFLTNCKADSVEKVSRQDLIDYMKWQRGQALPKRKHSNPERTYHNRLINVRSFLNTFGVTRLLRKGEYKKRYHEKKVVAHPDHELEILYSHADAEEWFLLDYFIGSMVRDHEAYGGDVIAT